MFEIVDINVLICTYLDVQGISNLLRASRTIYKVSCARIVIEKVIRKHRYSDTKLYTRKVLDKYENYTITDGIKYTVNDFGCVRITSFAGSPKRYVVYIDKYCRAKVIIGYNLIGFSSTHEITITSKWLDIFDLYYLHYSTCMDKQDSIEDLSLHRSKGKSVGDLWYFTDKLRRDNMSLDTFLSTHADQKIINFIRNI